MPARDDPQTRKTGQESEERAAAYLRRQGFRIRDRNYSTRFGEIDIVAEHRDDLVFVEVRSLRAPARHLPEETIGLKKQQRLCRTALAYLRAFGLEDRAARFDVVAVERDGDRFEIRHIADAFELWEP